MYCEESDDNILTSSSVPAECATPVLDVQNTPSSQAEEVALCGTTPAVLESATPNTSINATPDENDNM